MKKGFSLVELSIVLVVLSLLVGGILAGQSLIRASELRGIVTDADRYNTAVLAFRDKYFALPGDMTNATSFWGQAPDCTAQTASGITTCNGNGNGIVLWGGTYNERAEAFTFWQHLSNAGLIPGNYTGVRGPGTLNASSVAGTNVPRTKLNGCFSVFPFNTTPTANLTAQTGGNAFTIGPVSISGGVNPDYCYWPMILPEEMWNIDTKTDDGVPGTGNVVSWNTVRAGNCVTSDDPTTATYKITYKTGAACSVIVRMK